MPDLNQRTSSGFKVDEAYEFAAPKFFDFLANMDESGSIKGEKDDDAEGEWFETDHSPQVPFSKLSTPKRPTKLLVSSSSSRPKRQVRTPKMNPNDHFVDGLPTTVTKNRKKMSQSPMTGTDCSIPSPLQDQNGKELVDCDALLAEFGLSPLPKALKLKPKASAPLKRPSPLRKSTNEQHATKTPSRMPRNSTAQPSPLRQISLPSNKNAPGSVYKRLFQMQAKAKVGKVAIPTKLKVGPDVIPAKSMKPLTIPKEFNFATTSRLKKYRKKTAETNVRKRSSPLKNQVKQAPAVSAVKKLTEPRSPKLSYRNPPRKSAVHTLPVVSPKKVNVSAKPTSVQQKTITVPKPPKFATEDRIALKQQFKKRIDTETSVSQFKATPLPKEILKKPIGIPMKPSISVTIPHTPNIRQSKRLREADPLFKSIQPSPFRAKPVPVFDSPFKPVVNHQHTQPADFHLPGEKYSQAKRQKFLEKIEAEMEEQRKAKEFHAREILKAAASKPVTPRPLTVPKPFKLATDVRGSSAQQRFQEALQEQLQQEANSRQFKAHPAPHPDPFVPEKSDKPLTCPAGIELKTEDRAERWHDFEEHLKEKEEALAKAKQIAQEEQQRKLEQEIREMRQKLVPKVNPIRKYAPVVVKPSTRRLTQPKSPKLSTSIRVKRTS